MEEGLGEMGNDCYPYGVSYWDDKNVPKLIVVILHNLVTILKIIKLYTLNR